MSWTAILVLAAGAYGFKLAGVLLGDLLPDGRIKQAIQLIPPALFCALVALQTFTTGTDLVVDARIVGLIVAIVATAKRVPFLGVLVLAMAATAVTRLLTG